MVGIIKTLLALTISMPLLASCSVSKYAIYESSEAKRPSIVFDPGTGEYWLSDKIPIPILAVKPETVPGEDSVSSGQMAVYKRNNYFYVVGSNVVLPFGKRENIIENYKSICLVENIDGQNIIGLKCNLENREYEFEFSKDRGIVRFKAECLYEFDKKCTFSLKTRYGIFINGYIPEQIKQFNEFRGHTAN